MVAIIGNRGSGKSALSDAIGLLGNSRNSDSFSFLNGKRFKLPSNNKARHFSAEITWENNVVNQLCLNDSADDNLPELVRYLPQGLFDDICNEIDSGDDTNFSKELKQVIFSHVSQANRLGTTSLDELINIRTDETYDAINILKERLHQINVQIVELEEKSTVAHRRQLESQIAIRTLELEDHEKNRPTEPEHPGDALKWRSE